MRARTVAVAGLVGALAMVPVGLALSAMGFEVNRYGELLAEQLTGSRRPAVLFALHLVIGVVSAVPLAVVAAVLHPLRVIMLVGGGVYGAAYWLGVNALALPLVYRRPFPWIEGVASVWPSLLVHVVYGLAAALVLAQAVIPDGAGPRHRGSRCGLYPLLRRARRRRGSARRSTLRARHGDPGPRTQRDGPAAGSVS